MTLKQAGGVSGQELHSKLVKARKIPNHATTEEVLTTVRQAVLEYGRFLHHQKKSGKYSSEGAAREWSTVVFVIVIFIS